VSIIVLFAAVVDAVVEYVRIAVVSCGTELIKPDSVLRALGAHRNQGDVLWGVLVSVVLLMAFNIVVLMLLIVMLVPMFVFMLSVVVGCMHKLWVLVHMVRAVSLFEVVMLLGFLGMSLESLVMTVLVGLELLHPALSHGVVLGVVGFIQRVSLFRDLTMMSLGVLRVLMSVSDSVMSSVMSIMAHSMMGSNLVMIFLIKHLSVVISFTFVAMSFMISISGSMMGNCGMSNLRRNFRSNFGGC